MYCFQDAPDHPALMVKRDGSWKTWTYEEVKKSLSYHSSLYPCVQVSLNLWGGKKSIFHCSNLYPCIQVNLDCQKELMDKCLRCYIKSRHMVSLHNMPCLTFTAEVSSHILLVHCPVLGEKLFAYRRKLKIKNSS